VAASEQTALAWLPWLPAADELASAQAAISGLSGYSAVNSLGCWRDSLRGSGPASAARDPGGTST